MDNTTTNVQGREIKFRAIVPVNSDEPKTMQYFDLSKIDDCNRLAYADYDIKGLMQFTGLRDKSGKEIYESDRLKVDDNYDKFGFAAGMVGTVIFDKGKFMLKDEHGKFFFEDNQMDYVEVIGNLYEPPTEGIIAEGLIDHGV